MLISVSSQEGVSSCRSAANYARVFHASCGRSVSRRKFQRRLVGILHVMPAPFVRCATIEEIEVEKFMIDADAKQRMEKTIETVRENFNSIITGRSNPAMLDKIEVEYYGSPVHLKSIDQISTPDSSFFLVQPYDKSSPDLGLTPNNVGEVIRLSLPQLTSDRRKELKDDYMKKIDCLQAKSEGVNDCLVKNQLYVGHFVGIHRDQTNACVTVSFE